MVFDTISHGYLSVGKDYHMNEHNQKHLTLSNRTCAFGMAACKQYYNTKYVRMPDLLMDLDIARSEGNYRVNAIIIVD